MTAVTAAVTACAAAWLLAALAVTVGRRLRTAAARDTRPTTTGRTRP